MKMTLPEGWIYEGPDESVGIFGEAFFHCGGDYEAKVEEISECVINSWPAPDSDEDDVKEVEFTLRLSCPCGATVDITKTDLV